MRVARCPLAQPIEAVVAIDLLRASRCLPLSMRATQVRGEPAQASSERAGSRTVECARGDEIFASRLIG